jgi:hypothetical protein
MHGLGWCESTAAAASRSRLGRDGTAATARTGGMVVLGSGHGSENCCGGRDAAHGEDGNTGVVRRRRRMVV